MTLRGLWTRGLPLPRSCRLKPRQSGPEVHVNQGQEAVKAYDTEPAPNRRAFCCTCLQENGPSLRGEEWGRYCRGGNLGSIRRRNRNAVPCHLFPNLSLACFESANGLFRTVLLIDGSGLVRLLTALRSRRLGCPFRHPLIIFRGAATWRHTGRHSTDGLRPRVSDGRRCARTGCEQSGHEA